VNGGGTIALMPGTNLTRDEAATRARQLSVSTYHVALDLTIGDKLFDSQTTIEFQCTEPGGHTFADLHGAIIQSINLNGVDLDPAAAYQDNRIRLDNLAAANTLQVHAEMPYSNTGEGLHRFVDPVDGRVYLYTQFEVPDARRVYTTFEQPDLKAAFEFTVTAPETWRVISNSVTPKPELLGHGRAVWAFEPTERMSTYITALVAGEYHEVLDEYVGKHGTILLGHYCRQSIKDQLDVTELLTLTKQGFAYFEELFDYPYPFGKYDQAYVPEYNMGAMENAGCVTFRDEYLPRSRQTRMFYEQRANTVLHEMAHMWFGDLVTMKWWDDLWLNESFAEWASHHAMANATEYTDAWTGFTNLRKNWAYRQDQLPSTHPIAADNHDLRAVEVNFDGITYAKGASTLKQLVAWVGIDPFIAGLREYFKAHAFANSEFGDLLGALEKASGRELDDWAKEWLQTSGVNTLAAEFSVDSSGNYSAFAVTQTADQKFPTLRRHRIGVGLYDIVDGSVVKREVVEVDIAGKRTELAELVGKTQPDLLLLNDGDLTYAKIRLDERSLRTAVQHIDAVSDSLTRALIWGAAWDMTRDAEMRASDFVALVLRGIGSETDQTAVAALPRYTKSAVNNYTAPAHRAQVKQTWENGIRKLLATAEPGSDSQLGFARAYASAAHTTAALDELQEWLTGTNVPNGLTLDADLRWAFVTSLAASGRVEEAQINDELAQDKTISGQEHAAMALAARPTHEAKDRAFVDVMERDDVPNETHRQTALGFPVAGQEEILAPFFERYLAAADSVWEKLGTHRASVALEFMFPLTLASEARVARLDDWLANSPADPAAKRYLAEGRADMARALAAQKRDAS
jgi:aminopeptidase N